MYLVDTNVWLERHNHPRQRGRAHRCAGGDVGCGVNETETSEVWETSEV